MGYTKITFLRVYGMEFPLDMFHFDFIEYVGRKFVWIYSRFLWAYLTYKKNIATLSLYI